MNSVNWDIENQLVDVVVPIEAAEGAQKERTKQEKDTPKSFLLKTLKGILHLPLSAHRINYKLPM